MNLTMQQVMTVIALSSTVTTAIFWGAYLIGKAMSRIERIEVKVEDHDREIRHLKGMGV